MSSIIINKQDNEARELLLTTDSMHSFHLIPWMSERERGHKRRWVTKGHHRRKGEERRRERERERSPKNVYLRSIALQIRIGVKWTMSGPIGSGQCEWHFSGLACGGLASVHTCNRTTRLDHGEGPGTDRVHTYIRLFAQAPALLFWNTCALDRWGLALGQQHSLQF